ncbi:MAG: rhodanese-like domain-containing protein [Ruminococcaceae bacterium]|nr:rhodanese-like domain-containing protein [Oscillospiraceae bacterium]
MRKILFSILLIILILTSCGKSEGEIKMIKNKDGYIEITQDMAKEIMDTEKDILIVDVREEDEYAESHIKGAMLLPLSVLKSADAEKASEEVIPDKSAKALVYCRSGRRSKEASKILADLGYSNIYEFGGILTWQYEIEK